MKKYFDKLNSYSDTTAEHNDIQQLLEVEEKYQIKIPEVFKDFYEYYSNNPTIMNGYANFYKLEDLKILENGNIIFADEYNRWNSYTSLKLDNNSIVRINRYDNVEDITSEIMGIEENYSSLFLDINDFMLFSVAYSTVLSMPLKVSYTLPMDFEFDEIYLTSFFDNNFKINKIFLYKDILCVYSSLSETLMFGIKTDEEMEEVKKYLQKLYDDIYLKGFNDQNVFVK
ncbi:hypothetical protein AN396_09395 [Candidatus Epulonipiscium fishelsonii]|uniref:Uncharacterized protein n=1 Tax=Candidatus Epulonipiscium fishelsonii TaxID=77094 RepID=A0ACC8XA78_9FIRM|nr:hypothetical protein AN396_09395 [Epulopiscium sp. SCG-B11WGA-EpuloA1]